MTQSLNEEDLVCKYSGILFTIRKEEIWMWVITQMDWGWGETEGKKQEEKQILGDLTHKAKEHIKQIHNQPLERNLRTELASGGVWGL